MRSVCKVAVLVLLGLGLSGCAWLFTPLQAVLTANPMSGVAPLSVTFTLSGSTGQITSWTLAFGDPSAPATGTDITANVNHTYTAPGTYTAMLTVQDSRGRTDTASVVITVAAPPTTTASLGVMPAEGPANLSVVFFIEAQAAPGRRIVHWKLDYDDGNEVELVVNTPSIWIPLWPYTYTAPGSYNATLTVTDSAAQLASASVTINVTSPPPEITQFKATHGGDEVNFDDLDPTLTIPNGGTVTFDFEATPAAGRTIKKWTLSCPGSNIPSAEEDNLTEDPLVRTGLSRIYTHTATQTQSYTATLKVWDDLNKTDEESLAIEVTP